MNCSDPDKSPSPSHPCIEGEKEGNLPVFTTRASASERDGYITEQEIIPTGNDNTEAHSADVRPITSSSSSGDSSVGRRRPYTATIESKSMRQARPLHHYERDIQRGRIKDGSCSDDSASYVNYSRAADAARRERRRKWPEKIGSDGKHYKAGGDIEVLEKPALEDLHGLRSEVYSAGSTRRSEFPASRMVSSSTSRSSLSHSSPISKHRHKIAHVYRSETEVKQRIRRKSASKDDGSSHSYVYVPPRPKARSSTIRVSERRREDDSSDTDEDGVISAVSEESELEPELKPRERKVKIIHVKAERPRSSRRNSLRVADDDKISQYDVKASAKSSHRSNTTSSHNLRSQSGQDIGESKPVMKRSDSLSQSHVPTKSLYEHSFTNSKATSKRTSFFGIFTPTIKEEEPPRL
jgi:hypothetical protein